MGDKGDLLVELDLLALCTLIDLLYLGSDGCAEGFCAGMGDKVISFLSSICWLCTST